MTRITMDTGVYSTDGGAMTAAVAALAGARYAAMLAERELIYREHLRETAGLFVFLRLTSHPLNPRRLLCRAITRECCRWVARSERQAAAHDYPLAP